jgi:sec-independent protein translocase protein TatA
VIPGLPQVGATELIILLSIILLLFGAKRIPELARSLGRGKREFHKGAFEDADAVREQGELPEDEEEESTHPQGSRVEQRSSS